MPDNQILVIFGASGDLTKRKLIPAIFELEKQKLLPEKFAVLGIGRTEIPNEEFRQKMVEGVKIHGKCDDKYLQLLDDFARKLYYKSIDTKDRADYIKVKDELQKIDSDLDIGGNYIFYLSTPPSLYGIIPEYLASHGLNKSEKGWRRIIIEKPFGYDLNSAKELNKRLLEDYDEDQLYRIDHYLGKETVQNVLVTRFSNGIFEPLWNRNYVERVEITSAEYIGVENRGGYYDQSGAMRDMVQNHLLQVAGLIAMEPPSSFDSTSIRNEVLKVFQSIRKLSDEEIHSQVIRGQYLESFIKGQPVPGYRQEKGVDPDSKTETFVAMKFFVDNWRWGGVPFYIRSGKRLPTRVTEVVIHFKETPHSLFGVNGSHGVEGNKLIIRIQPDEGILLKFGMKIPGAGFNVQTVNMDFHYSNLTHERIPEAYERLLLDCMVGDSTLYSRGDAVLSAWEFITPILDAWRNDPLIKIYGYPAGSWGPDNCDDLVSGKATWRYPCKNLSDDGLYCEL
ncbi:MAG: glucose-6-phosphate dehydrogenase [Melioribacteraceae bacterium]|nr:glucose-6-phosphate dehydrogenase [Melioribacteraceae bacterium]MCF8264529.1 glucose-6-phosphate dehydrogenase [Melioribacteraceae bacterium]